jgi:hypothetical protein
VVPLAPHRSRSRGRARSRPAALADDPRALLPTPPKRAEPARGPGTVHNCQVSASPRPAPNRPAAAPPAAPCASPLRRHRVSLSPTRQHRRWHHHDSVMRVRVLLVVSPTVGPPRRGAAGPAGPSAGTSVRVRRAGLVRITGPLAASCASGTRRVSPSPPAGTERAGQSGADSDSESAVGLRTPVSACVLSPLVPHRGHRSESAAQRPALRDGDSEPVLVQRPRQSESAAPRFQYRYPVRGGRTEIGMRMKCFNCFLFPQ